MTYRKQPEKSGYEPVTEIAQLINGYDDAQLKRNHLEAMAENPLSAWVRLLKQEIDRRAAK